VFLTIASFLLPALFVFGVYHLLTWVNAFRLNQRVFWIRVAIASAISHVLLATGFFVFLYVDFQNRLRLEAVDTSFGAFLFGRSDFWRLITIFDTLPMLAVLGVSAGLDRAGINPPGLLLATFVITYVAGTFQWFWIGGGIGALLERFWAGLKTGEPEDDEWL
jgi:hypothetical protein